MAKIEEINVYDPICEFSIVSGLETHENEQYFSGIDKIQGWSDDLKSTLRNSNIYSISEEDHEYFRKKGNETIKIPEERVDGYEYNEYFRPVTIDGQIIMGMDIDELGDLIKAKKVEFELIGVKPKFAITSSQNVLKVFSSGESLSNFCTEIRYIISEERKKYVISKNTAIKNYFDNYQEEEHERGK